MLTLRVLSPALLHLILLLQRQRFAGSQLLQRLILHPGVVQRHMLLAVGHQQYTLAPDHQVGVVPHWTPTLLLTLWGAGDLWGATATAAPAGAASC